MTDALFLVTIIVHFTGAFLGFWAMRYDQSKTWYTLAYLTMSACMIFGLLHVDIWFMTSIETPTLQESFAYLIHGITAIAFHAHLIRKGSNLA